MAGTPASPDLAAAQPQQASGGGGRPGWQLGVIIAAVLAGLILAACVVLVPYIMVRTQRDTPSPLLFCIALSLHKSLCACAEWPMIKASLQGASGER